MDTLIHYPDVKRALGLKSTKGLAAVCARYEIPTVRLTRRVFALRASDYERLLQRASGEAV